MAMMAKMRSLAPWFIITVGGVFVLFMVLSDSKISKLITQRPQDVGLVNDEAISYQNFQRFVDQAKANQVKQTGQDIDESQMDSFRDQVWDAIVSQTLMKQKIDDYGITVTDQEIIDIILGPNPPDFLKQGFIDSTGNFNREAYEAALTDPRNREPIIAAEEGVRQQQTSEKLKNFVNAAVTVSDDEIKRQFIDRNIKMSADYALISSSTIPDSAITVSDDDLMQYYNDNKEEYKILPMRKIKYVLFKKEASKGDSTGVLNNLQAIIAKLKGDTASFKTYVEIYSDQPYSKDSIAVTDIPDAAKDLIMNAKKGDIIGPVLTPQGYVVYKLDRKFKSKNPVVKAAHILVKSEGDDASAKKEANEIYKKLKNGADFAELAKENSDDPGSAVRGGDLGWFGKGQMVPEFEKACFSGRLNVIQRPVKTNYGYHIIKVTGKTNYHYVIEKIVNKIEPTGTTLDKIYNNANDFSYLADKNGFDSEVHLSKYKVVESPAFIEKNGSVPGLGINRGLVHFAFNNSVGSISEAFKVRLGYVVAMVSEIVNEGYKTLEQVKNIIKPKVLIKKKLDETFKIAKEIRNKIGDSGNLLLATSVYKKAKVSSAKDFTTNGNVTGVGSREYAFTSYALNAPLNEISDAIKGKNSSYIIKVTKRTKFDSTAFSLQKNFLRDNLLRQKKSQFFNQWLTTLKNKADIVDQRYLFYR